MKKFGLIIPDSKKKATGTVIRNDSVKKPVSIFNEDDSDGDDDEKELAALRKARTEQSTTISKSISASSEFVEKIHEEALKEDPNIFDYDASIDSNDRKNVHRNLRFANVNEEQNQKQQQEENKNEPKYMHNILAKAEERKMESELIKLRNMKRKSGAIDKEDGEEVFITSAYSQRLKELEEKEKELKARQIREEDGDVTKRKDMSGFYYNLMKRNVSFGGQMRSDEPIVLETKKSKVEEIPLVNTVETTQEVPLAAESVEEEEISFGPRRPPIKK